MQVSVATFSQLTGINCNVVPFMLLSGKMLPPVSNEIRILIPYVKIISLAIIL